MEFNKFFGKFRSLWAELEMLRPATLEASILNERREQDKVFALLMVLNPAYNDLIKHILRSDKLPSLDEVCAQIQKEQGSLGLLGVKGGELVMANKAEHKVEHVFSNKSNYRSYGDRSSIICDHCKKPGHSKDRCYFLHPHLRPTSNSGPNKWRDRRGPPRAQIAAGERQEQGSTTLRQNDGEAAALAASSEFVRKADLDALIKSLKESGNSITSYSYQASSSFNPNQLVKASKPLIVDSGASHHMISDAKLMSNLKPALGDVVIANGDRIPIKGIGDLRLFNKDSKALYMPSFTSNLLSVKRTTSDLNFYAIFGPNDVYFQDIETSEMLGKGKAKNDLYVLEDTKRSSPLSCSFTSAIPVITNAMNTMWHARLGHPHSRALKLMLPNISFDNDKCESCILGKHCKTVFPSSSTVYEKCFDLIHSDVWTSPCLSRENHKYFVTFIDEKSKYTWLTLLPSKDRVLEAFINFQSYVTNHYNAKIKTFRSDNGGEYTSKAFKQFLDKNGIIHQTSCPYTPQQNGVAERKNRHLMEVARSMMFHTNVPKRFWGDAVVTACYLINRIPTKILNDLSPFKVLNQTEPSIDYLRVFGCVCFVLIPGEQRNKLDAKSVRGMFIGYSINQKGYKCYIPETRRVLVSRDVKFIESKGYYEEKNWEELKDLSHSSDRAATLRVLLESLRDGVSHEQIPTHPISQAAPDDDSQSQEVSHVPTNTVEPDGDENHSSEEQDEPQGSVEVQPAPQEGPQVLRRSQRIRKPSNWVNTRVYYNSNAVAHPIQASCSLAFIPQSHQAYINALDNGAIPQSYEEAMELTVWVEAVEDETQAMERNHTWDEADLPKGKRAVTSKWVFTIKYLSTGEIERHKARLVARGFTQTYGQDYLDTFAPVAKLHTVRVVLALAANLDWDLWQMDVKNAFLQGDLDEEVYMTPPPGITVTPGKVLRLRKAIYGLKQSPRAWYQKLSTTLRDRGFRRSESDHTLFTLQSQEGIIVVLIYVDDIIISGNNKVGIQDTKAFLHSVFDIKDLGELKYFLGIEVCRSTDGLFLSQRKYILDLLCETGNLEAKPAPTPLEDTYKANQQGESDTKSDCAFHDAPLYRKIVGKLIYLTLTRPDLCFAVNQASQYMQTPMESHWKTVNHILRYIRGTSDQGIWMGCNGSTDLVGYCDADYAGDRSDRRSTTGYCTFIGGNLVTWKSKKQKVVSCSSCEAEYRAMRRLTTELMWLKMLLKDLGIETPKPITMHCDNQAAIHIASNSVFHERTKHIEVDCHKVREQMQLGVILPCYTKSSDQLADIFTKAASSKNCEFINNKLGLLSLSRP
uniref:Retrovirus-related Pol polyprotein from transposon TNT 1-94 n=4 Tax=Noccaea caerulescens TaxID=107243 RepID=A0A1J3J2T0_NOCCA